MVAEVIDPVAGELDINIEMGATFDLPMVWSDETGTAIVGLENWAARMHIRSKVSDPNPLLELTTENGAIVLGGEVGEIRLYLTDSQTSAFTWARGIYQLELVSPTGRVTRLLKGKVLLDSEVTK